MLQVNFVNSLSIVNFEHVNAGWDARTLTCTLRSRTDFAGNYHYTKNEVFHQGFLQ